MIRLDLSQEWSTIPARMKEQIASVQNAALSQISNIADMKELEEARVSILGKKGSLTQVQQGMRNVAKEDKPLIGALLNEARSAISTSLDARREELQSELDAQAVAGSDLTLPGHSIAQGGLHPISIVLEESLRILRRMGFTLADGPEIEDEWHCFDALNTPTDHPARNEKDTFYFDSGKLLRTHTSTVQTRAMEKQTPPLRIVCPGSAFRRDAIDATHLSVFNQIEGLYVAEKVSVNELKGTLEYFLKALFGSETSVRFRPHFFPFTEPSFEIDVLLQAAGQAPRWIEIAGCGMVNPAVFENIDKETGKQLYSNCKGFAFGIGLERLAMIRWGIRDIRLLIENDLRFLSQFQ